MNCLAAIFRTPNHPLELTSVSLPVLTRGEVRVKVTCCTICGSDLHTLRGKRPVPGATILGHEIIGVIDALPNDGAIRDLRGQPLKRNDKVTWSIAAACHRCFYCQRGLPQKCDDLFKYGHEPIDRSDGPSGGLSQVCHLREGTSLLKLPANLPDTVACPSNCATATVVAAVRRIADPADKRIVILGAGMLGVTAAAMLRQRGAAAILATDVVPNRLKAAAAFGIDQALAADDQLSIERAVRDVTDGRGADVILDMSGSPSAIMRSIDLLRIGGQLILVGSVFPTQPLSISPEMLVRRMIRIEGVHNYTPDDLLEAVRFLELTHSVYPFETLVQGRYALHDVNRAIDEALRSDIARIAVFPN